MIKIFTIVFFIPLFSIAQDSPLQAAPGSPPPPQGFTNEAPPNGGIHLPSKTPKKKYKLKMGTPPNDASIAAPKATPAKTN
jgi:hypothetical protein